MNNTSLPIAIVGHVDHGKSTLIGRLLLDTKSLPPDKLEEIKKISKELGRETQMAYLTDQLEEEREKNITIDTTQIFFKTSHRNYVIIDTPGHVEFLKNMLSGTSFAQAVILIVDTNEGIQEQTRRHAYLVGMLGIRNVIVLCNKMDLVQYSQEAFERLQLELQEVCKQSNLNPIATIPVSAWNGDNVATKSSNMPWYKGKTFLQVLDAVEGKKENASSAPLRLPIQDIYEMDAKIVVGKIIQGTLKQKQTVKIMPLNEQATIKEIRVFGKTLKSATVNENIGIIFDKNINVARGQLIVDSNCDLIPVTTTKAHLFWLSEEPWQVGTEKTFRCETIEVHAQITQIKEKLDSNTLQHIEHDDQMLRMNETAIVQLTLSSPQMLEPFDTLPEMGRFVIEINNHVQGFGVILA